MRMFRRVAGHAKMAKYVSVTELIVRRKAARSAFVAEAANNVPPGHMDNVRQLSAAAQQALEELGGPTF